ncbi:hypothetical protein PILCRDRAFT_11794 [Piloderma croceum F 1598]|uniref:Crinkler effector protein N-terminal domain-containing protein n=1 Tax=Piloderma croceum (strain F 1598) TaxID=765440 RepID=A0A0C3EYV5_PILCF|nr:hypothetical protein PILCRDRAFT_11794 [Piloderma croceum F 1598]
MTDNQSLVICCLVHRDSRVFKVKVSGDDDIADLKDLVYQKGISAKHTVLAKDLNLWMLNEPLPTTPHKILSERLSLLGTDFSQFAIELEEPGREISEIFSQPPLKGHLHVIVDPQPAVLSACAPTLPLHRSSMGTCTPLRLTFHGQPRYQVYIPKLEKHKYIQIRGTPGCGKTALAKLLEAYARQKKPNAQVTYLRSWLSQANMPRGGWKEWLKLKLDSDIVLIVDEAQSSYWDTSFWLELKDINPDSACHVITLASYGSAGHNIYDPMTPLHISQQQRISLVAADHGDQIAVGLLLTKAEFDEVVPKLFQNHQFDVSFLDSVFDITGGHVGACEDFLRVVCAHASYRSLNATAKNYTYDDFITSVDMIDLLMALASSSVFGRGLPSTTYLQDASFAKVFQEVIQTGGIVVPEVFDQLGEVPEKTALRKCFEFGWLYNEAIGPTEVLYTFPSPLHMRYIQLRLMVIRKFIPLNLSARRTFGTTIQSTPEAQFRDEFYCACISHTNNCVLTFPEFGNKRGRIDFLIPMKKWGIELLRNGDRLNAHAARFTTGEYSQWINDHKINDYVIVDFRTKLPWSNHKDIKNLLYVVSTDNWKTVEVRNNQLVALATFSHIYT